MTLINDYGKNIEIKIISLADGVKKEFIFIVLTKHLIK